MNMILNHQNATSFNVSSSPSPINHSRIPAEEIIFSFRNPTNPNIIQDDNSNNNTVNTNNNHARNNTRINDLERRQSRESNIAVFDRINNVNNINSVNDRNPIINNLLRINNNVFNSKVKSIIKKIIALQIISFIFTFLIILWIKWSISILFSVGFLVLVDIIYLIFSLYKYKNSTREKQKDCCLEILSILTFLGFKITSIVILIKCIGFKLIFAFMPYLVIQIMQKVSIFCQKNRDICQIYTMLSKCFKGFLCVQGIFILLKVDGLVLWTWREVFWTFWIFFSIMIGISFSLFLVVISKACSFLVGQIRKFEMRGIFWLFSTIGGFTVFSCLFVMNFLDYIENNQPIDIAFMDPIYALLTYNIFIILYTLAYFNDIENFFRKIFSIEIESNIDLSITQTKDKQKKSETQQKIEIPRFLLQANSTFFKKASEEDYRLKITKTSRKKLNKDIENKEKVADYRQLGSKTDHTEHTSRDQLSQFTSTPSTRFKDDMPNKTTGFSPRSSHRSPRFETMNDRSSSIINKEKYTGDKSIGDMRIGLKLNTIHSEIEKSVNLSFNVNPNYGHNDENDKSASHNIGQSVNLDNFVEPENLSLQANQNTQSTKTNGLKKVTFFKNPPKINYIYMQDKNIDKDINLASPNSEDLINLNNPDLSKNKQADEELNSPGSATSKNLIIKENDFTKEDDKSNNACLVCFDKQPDAVLMECGHGGICYDCSLEVWKSTNECFLCRNAITQILQIELPILKDGLIKVISSTQMINYEIDNS